MMAGKKPAIVFIIGGGLNYISAVLAESYPKITSVSLQPCDDFFGHEISFPRLSWRPSSAVSLHETIRKAIAGNRLAGGVMILEWPPVVSKFQNASERIRATLRDILEEASSNAATIGYWANRWLLNSLRFVRSVTTTARLVPGTSPVVLACAGPSLVDFMPQVLNRRSSMALWALASAVPALLRYGLSPDLVIATDPGFWNGAHLRDAFMHDIPIAMPPSCYASSQILHGATIIPIDTGLSFERAAMEATGLDHEVASASGSAAGTALSLALRLTDGPVALAGYDLAARGLIEHASPYAFDILDEKSADRLAPACSVRAARVLERYPSKSGDWRRSRAFSAYAETIRVPEHDASRVFRLGSSIVETPIQRADFSDIPFTSGIAPRCARSPDRGDAEKPSRSDSMRAMLKSLSEAAFEQAHTAIVSAEPLPYDAALYYKALAPRESARLIADAARGEATMEDVMLAASAATKTGAVHLQCRTC